MTAFSAMLGLGVISPFLPELAKQHGANGFWLGMIFAGFGVSRGILVPFVGKYSDKIGRKPFVTSGLFLYTVIAFTYPQADSIYALTLVRLAHGLAVGMIIPILMVYIGDFAEKGRTGVSTSSLNMMFYMGVAAGPFIGGYIGQRYGFDSVFHLMSVLGGITFLVVLFFLPESLPSDVKTEKEEIAVTSLLKYSFIKAVLIATVLITLLTATFISFVPSLAERIKMDPSHVGIILSIGIFLAGLLQIPSGRIAEKLDELGKMIQIGTGTCISMLALFVMPFCPDFRALLAAGCILGVGTAISTSALLCINVEIGKKAGMATWIAVYNVAINLGFVVTPLLAGIIMDHLGIDAVFYLFGLLAFFIILGFAQYIRLRILST
jgi:MFS family permease